MSDLKPCPFCGNTEPEFERIGTPRQSCIVVCGNCGARHESSDEGEDSGTSWNRRAQPAQAGQVLSDEEIQTAWVEHGLDDCAVEDFARAIESAVRAKLGAAVSQWLPIETAPKDGTPILLARDHRVTAGHWEPERYPTATEYHSTTGEYLGQFETGEVIDAWWYSEDGGFDEENHPTHWMPLPPPPIVGKEGA